MSNTVKLNSHEPIYLPTINSKISFGIAPFGITYKLNGIDIAANVYTPANYDASRNSRQ